MNSPKSKRPKVKGSALITVVFLLFMMAMLTASILLYSGGENRANNRNRLILRARNMAENIALYASEQITTKLYRIRNQNPRAFMDHVAGVHDANEVMLPTNTVLNTQFTSATNGMEVYAGIPAAGSALAYIDPAVAANAGNPNVGLQASNSVVKIIAKATATHPVLGSVVSYAEQDLEVATIPLFQFAVFYNMDMEFGPGADMVISGPVHTNGNLIARDQSSHTNTLEFQDRVTTAKGFFANTGYKGPTVMNDGSVDNGPGGTGHLYFTSPSGVKTDIYNGTIWRDHFYGVAYTSPATASTVPPATSLASFKTFATTTYGNNLRTSVHGVTPLVLPAVSNYKETDDPATPEDDRDNGRQVLEVPDPADTAGLLNTKVSRNAGLYILVNPTPQFRSGTLPDASTAYLCPYSYRCFLNTVNNDLTYTIAEVIIPGQPTWGYNNAGTPGTATDDYSYKNVMPNAYITTTSVGANQVLRIPQQGPPTPVPLLVAPANATPAASTGYGPVGHATAPTFASFEDSYFYDMRRATNSYPATRSAGTPYTPRPITKIDLDMTRFRMMAERTLAPVAGQTSTVYFPSLPTGASAATQWSHFIFNSAATTAAYGLGLGSPAYTTFPTALTMTAPDPFMMYFAPANPADPALLIDPRAFAVGPTYLFNSAIPCPWKDGISVYINSVAAEDSSYTGTVRNRPDSGVRLINGRGPVVSLPSATGLTGFTMATNDAVYIVGHFNADGTINSTSSDTTNPGGYSAVYPESANEYLTSLMGDAITIVSQPSFINPSGTNYVQQDGWADALSSHVAGSTASSGTWQTSAPSGSNTVDGINTSQTAGDMPNLSTPSVNGSAPANVNKNNPINTEISACLLLGIVPTNHNPTGLTATPPTNGPDGQTSGGVHNYPRLSETWGSAGLYFRGSMVAMFESRVAMEPWGIRYYSAPGRYWGMNNALRASGPSHHVPLEPLLLNARRMRYLELTPALYNSTKTTIQALPH